MYYSNLYHISIISSVFQIKLWTPFKVHILCNMYISILHMIFYMNFKRIYTYICMYKTQQKLSSEIFYSIRLFSADFRSVITTEKKIKITTDIRLIFLWNISLILLAEALYPVFHPVFWILGNLRSRGEADIERKGRTETRKMILFHRSKS